MQKNNEKITIQAKAEVYCAMARLHQQTRACTKYTADGILLWFLSYMDFVSAR